ncbi:hypothetical protein, partial [Sphingobacterium populi]|uniref:hypothetical protein n=1 Tax=Sphingobacterium sp. CFCC 11742 TaxID=1775560 RepID=UPI00397A993C
MEEKSAGSQTLVILMLSILFVYFLLSAQYESYLLPLAVLLAKDVGYSHSLASCRTFCTRSLVASLSNYFARWQI